MDNLTHSLFALTLARTPLGRAGAGTTAVLLIGSNAPDMDIVAAFTGGSVAYLAAHRGASHGPLGILGLAVATATAVAAWVAWRADRSTQTARRAWRRLMPVALVAVSLHVAMDLPTSYRTRVLSPFVDAWFGVDWIPIIDVYLLAALAAGLVLPSVTRLGATRVAFAALAVMSANYVVRGGSHLLALERARSLTAPPQAVCRGSGHAATARGTDRREDCPTEIAALPSFLSPFRWRLVRRFENGYELADYSLVGGGTGVAVWYPDERNEAVARGRRARTIRVFLDFARFPAVRTFPEPGGHVIVTWTDLRFAGGLVLDRASALQVRGPFVATVRLDPAGAIVEERMGPG